MAGSVAGGKRAAITSKAKYGDDFYKVIGKAGGHKGTTGGFAAGEAGRQRAIHYGKMRAKKHTFWGLIKEIIRKDYR